MNNEKKNSKDLYYTKKQIKDIIPGDIVLHPIYRSDGLMLVNKNKTLSAPLISMVKNHTVHTSHVLTVSSKENLQKFLTNNISSTLEFEEDIKKIFTEFNKNTTLPVNIENKININTLNNSNKNISLENNNFLIDMLLEYPLWTSLDSKLESEILKTRANEVKEELIQVMNNTETFSDLFTKIKDYDDVLLIHSINTTCLSLIIGLTLELNNDELFDLAIAALFSNVGFIEMPNEDFKKYLRTHDFIFEPIKRHLEIFSTMTEDFPILRKKSIIYGILDHHEYYSGKGYPNGKQGEEISLFGRIILIAHTYDELVGGYKYKIGIHPLDALKIIYENKENKYDKNILNVFIHRSTYFKLGQTTYLPNMQKAEIIGFENFLKLPHFPIVKLENGKIINLAKSKKYY